MTPDSPANRNALPEIEKAYAQWRREKRSLQAPDGLTDAILEALEEPNGKGLPSRPAAPKPWPTFLDKPWIRAAVLVGAATVGLGRYLLLLFCLFAP